MLFPLHRYKHVDATAIWVTKPQSVEHRGRFIVSLEVGIDASVATSSSSLCCSLFFGSLLCTLTSRVGVSVEPIETALDADEAEGTGVDISLGQAPIDGPHLVASWFLNINRYNLHGIRRLQTQRLLLMGAAVFPDPDILMPPRKKNDFAFFRAFCSLPSIFLLHRILLVAFILT